MINLLKIFKNSNLNGVVKSFFDIKSFKRIYR